MCRGNWLPALIVLLGLAPAEARAQWYVAGYAGANYTQPASITIDQPARGTHLTFVDVTFESQSFVSPQYYGYRIGWLGGRDRRWGLEFEFIHPKVYSRTTRPVRVHGRIADAPIDATVRMDSIVERYAMSHGLNFAMVNFVARVPLGGAGGPVAFLARAGAGPTIIHAESTIGGEALDQYESGGLGLHAAAGLDVRLRGRLSALAEYKLGFARPVMSIPAGTGRTTSVVHQVALGVAFGVSR